jgi:RNA methyltransferase, TrmH family
MLSKTQVKYIQSLVHKKFREQHGQYIIEGPKLLSEALNGDLSAISKIYAYPEWLDNPGFSIPLKGIDIIAVSEADMKRISALSTPGPVLAILQMPQKRAVTVFPGITLLLDAIQDPGNLGTIIRTADWFGIQNIICGEGCVDCYNTKVIQSTMGSIFRMNIMYRELGSFIDQWPGMPVMASSLDGTLMQNIKKDKEAFLVIGNESKGISRGILEKATVKVRIPGGGGTESLNAAVATGILLYWLTVDS